MKENDILLIQDLESTYDKFYPKLEAILSEVETFKRAYHDYGELVAFYGSDKWFELSDQPTDGIKAGILSEDQLFNLITDHNQLLGELLDLTALMYKHI